MYNIYYGSLKIGVTDKERLAIDIANRHRRLKIPGGKSIEWVKNGNEIRSVGGYYRIEIDENISFK